MRFIRALSVACRPPAAGALAADDRLSQRARQRRGDRGDTLAFLVLWPAMIMAVLLLLVHVFIVTNAQAEADAAASEGLRAAWRASANSDFLADVGPDPDDPANEVYVEYQGAEPHDAVLAMAEAAKNAAAQSASNTSGWRWWTPGVTRVESDWCSRIVWSDPADPRPQGSRPVRGETGWVRVVVSGDVFGPLAALWPDRLERVYAVAVGPAVLTTRVSPEGSASKVTVPADMPVC